MRRLRDENGGKRKERGRRGLIEDEFDNAGSYVKMQR